MSAKPSVFLPVRGTSDSVSPMNLSLLDGKPLFLYVLEKLLNLEDAEIFLDTESDEIVQMSSHLEGLRILKRDPSLALNNINGNHLFANQALYCQSEIIVQHLCTSPFISLDTIKKAIHTIRNDATHDSILAVRTQKLYTWNSDAPAYDIKSIPKYTDLDNTVVETMGLYASPRNRVLETGLRIGERPYLMEVSPEESIYVRNDEDFALAQLIAAGKREKEQNLYANMSLVMSSALLSDLLDDYGFKNQVIHGLKATPGMPKILGPAKTMRIRKIRDQDDFRGIYSCLNHYKTLVPGDVICIENEVDQYAYFGELNANLAIRQGVRGVIVGGMTRDAEAVVRTGLPVYAMGVTCQDVRGRAVLDTLNQKISIDNVFICPGDLVFADSEGVVVIPRRIIHKVFSDVSQKTVNESHIITDIASGIQSEKLLQDRGDF